MIASALLFRFGSSFIGLLKHAAIHGYGSRRQCFAVGDEGVVRSQESTWRLQALLETRYTNNI